MYTFFLIHIHINVLYLIIHWQVSFLCIHSHPAILTLPYNIHSHHIRILYIYPVIYQIIEPSLSCITAIAFTLFSSSMKMASPSHPMALFQYGLRFGYSPCPLGKWLYPNTVKCLTTFTPLKFIGHINIDCCEYCVCSISVFTINIHILQRGCIAFEVHHFRHYNIILPISRFQCWTRNIPCVWTGHGWLCQTKTTSNGTLHQRTYIFFFLKLVSIFCNTSMFPVSGALPLHASCTSLDLPIISHRGEYSCGKNKFHV